MPLKLPKVALYPAMMRHFRECIQGAAQPMIGPAEGLVLMQMVDAIYRSAESGKSAEIKTAPAPVPLSPVLGGEGQGEGRL